jgi:tRNA-specific 2-thiouridylase
MGQRPMSQNKDSLQTVLNESNCDGLLLRPLSAKLLKPTIAEEQGWIDRQRLKAISGRSRDAQMQMVKEMGLKDFESPGGGCLLTDENFAKKMFDFIKYDKFEVKDIPIMKYGRHFRLSDGSKLVIGRDKDENKYLQDIDNDKYYHIRTVGFPGPHALLSKIASDKDKDIASRAVLTYCKISVENSYILSYDGKEVTSKPFSSRNEMKPFTIL